MKSDKSRGRFREAFTKEKVMRFLDKQGFYIVLFVCIAIIGVTAFMTSGINQKPQELTDKEKAIDQPELSKIDKSDMLKAFEEDKIDIKVKDSVPEPDKPKEDKPKEDKPKEDKPKEDKPKEDNTKETLASNTPKKEDKPKKEEAPKQKEEAPKQKEEAPKKNTGTSMLYPVQGKVLKGHTMDELVYSDTLKEWTTHPGMDIEAFVGAEVKAAISGTVEEITEDPLMGICITLDHGDGLKTYYANLSTSNMVSIGQKVDKGQIISGVGRTASAEILDNPHLHFEVRLDGKSVDPKNYIK